jgi:hypothetical protein
MFLPFDVVFTPPLVAAALVAVQESVSPLYAKAIEFTFGSSFNTTTVRSSTGS